ncbi:MAG: type I-U CRISPR-associated protein Csb2 [Vicinamibacterales bacterium]
MILLLSVRLLDGRFHGLAANGDRPNWPPSCFRLFQAIIAGNARGESIPPHVVEALKWLETLPPPVIVAPASKPGRVTLTYVLNNTEGRSRTQKFLRPTLLNGDRLIEFAWQYDPAERIAQNHADVLVDAVRHVRAFGWGIDLATGHGAIQKQVPEPSESRRRFFPRQHSEEPGTEIRVPREGSMDSLRECYRQYLGRFAARDSTLLESGGPLYQPWPYTAGTARPTIVFKIECDDEVKPFSYPQSKLVHVAGMVRHLARETMKKNPPHDLRGRGPAEWVESYVAGHRSPQDKADDVLHTQLSYVPMQSIGSPNTDPGVRRVMIVAPIGDEAWLEHVASRLDGALLKPLPNTTLPPGTRLERIDNKRKDGVRDAYLNDSVTWASVTPVILPGHNDHKPEKTRKLIEKALAQSGIDQPCEFEWSAFSHFRKMLPAHKYRKDQSNPAKKILINYIRPDHLLEQSAVHLKVIFTDAIPGPLTIGAGRHCGFGLMAAID